MSKKWSNLILYVYRNLASTLKAKNPHSDHAIPELQTQSLTGFFSEQLIADRITKLNEFLEIVTKSDEFQWGIRIDKDTCVYKRKTRKHFTKANRDTIRETTTRESISSMEIPRASSISISE
jgi:myosin-5